MCHSSSWSGLGEVPGQLCRVASPQGPFCASLVHLPHCFDSSDSSTRLSTGSFILLVVNSEMKCVFSNDFVIFKKSYCHACFCFQQQLNTSFLPSPVPLPQAAEVQSCSLCGCFELTTFNHHLLQNGLQCVFFLLLFCQPALFCLILIYSSTRGCANGREPSRDSRCGAGPPGFPRPRRGSAERGLPLGNVSPNLSQRCLFSLQHMLWWGLLIQQK